MPRNEKNEEWGIPVVGKVSNPHTGVESETVLWRTEAGEWEWQAHTQLQGDAESKMHHSLAKEQLCLLRSLRQLLKLSNFLHFPCVSSRDMQRVINSCHQLCVCSRAQTDWQDLQTFHIWRQTWAPAINFNTVLIVSTRGGIKDSKKEMFTWGIILTNHINWSYHKVSQRCDSVQLDICTLSKPEEERATERHQSRYLCNHWSRTGLLFRQKFIWTSSNLACFSEQ